VTRSLVALLVALAAASRAAGQITVVRPLDAPRHLVYRPPHLLSCPHVAYPDSLKRRNIGGRVVLELVVDTLGRVPRDRIVVRESSDNALSEAAIAMAVQCRFEPARVGRTAVQKVATIPVDFTVRRASP
jgi:TonB family protein